MQAIEYFEPFYCICVYSHVCWYQIGPYQYILTLCKLGFWCKLVWGEEQ